MTPAQRRIAARMSEAELEEAIRARAGALGIWRWHVVDASRMTPGLPDDILLGPGGLLWRENKSMTGRLTSEQRTVAQLLRAAGQDFGLWRPSDLLDGRIDGELARIAEHPRLFSA